MSKHRTKNWSRVICSACNGSGYIETYKRIDDHESLVKSERCTACQGCGLVNISSDKRKVK